MPGRSPTAVSRNDPSQSSSDPGGERLRCPSCEAAHRPDERFCRRCGMPLVSARPPAEGVEPGGDGARERARKIRPDLARGDLVRVAGGRNQAEAELIQNMLLEEGVPSLVRRAAGFDVPDFLAAGPRDVLVAESGAEAARALLVEAELAGPLAGADGRAGAGQAGADLRARATRLLVAIVAAALVAAAAAWALARLAG